MVTFNAGGTAVGMHVRPANHVDMPAGASLELGPLEFALRGAALAADLITAARSLLGRLR